MEIKTTVSGCGADDGDFLQWSKTEWQLHGAAKAATDRKEDICRPESDFIVFTENFPDQTRCSFAPK